jgi:hypothetical protein
MVTVLLVLLLMVVVWCLTVLIEMRNELFEMRRETKGWLDGIDLKLEQSQRQTTQVIGLLREQQKRSD